MLSHVCRKCVGVCPSARAWVCTYIMSAPVQKHSCVCVHTHHAGFLMAFMHRHINRHRCGHVHVQTLYMFSAVWTCVVCMHLGTGVSMCVLVCTHMPG